MSGNSTPSGTTIVVVQHGGQGCLVTALWFLFVGWWLSLLWIVVAWFLVAIVITMPLGLMMINKLPKIVSLREPSHEFVAVTQGLSARITETTLKQRPFLLRAVYFVLVGDWLSLLWMIAGWVVGVTIVGLPLSVWMFNRVPAVTTLKRY